MAGEKTYSGLRFWALFLAGLAFLDLGIMLVIITLHAAWPTQVAVDPLTPLFYILSLASIGSVVLGLFWFLFRYPAHRRTLLLLMLLTTGILVAHFYTINQPPTPQCFDNQKYVNGCVMDEIYYVPAAQALLSGEKCGPYLDNCNLEHPFLSKAIIAAGIAIFGNNDFGWRIFEVILGTLSIPLVFGICWSVTRDSRLSLFAAYLLAFETLFFVQSSIAVIDVQMIFFSLLAFLVYLANIRVWKLDRVTLAAILLGLSALSKETAIFSVAFLVVYNLLFGTGAIRGRLLSSVRMLAIVAVVFILGIQLYVTLFGNAQTTTFVDDIRYILDYGASLKCTATGCGWVDPVLNSRITPFSWMTFYTAVGYFVTRVTINPGNYTYVSLGYWGIANFFEVWLTYIWAPLVAYLAYKLWINSAAVVADVTTSLNIDTADFRIGRFALLWYALGYFPYIALYFYGRVTYPYYMLPVMPAISIGCAYLLTRKWFPREVAYVLLAGVFLWFFLYYPDKDFLPSQIRMFLGH
jgi:4-amino-4-deoxy-L-arabinose transferase-like glycosyltransferase